MYKTKRSIIAVLIFGLVAVIAAVIPHTGRGQVLEGNGEIPLNCDQQPCDSVARGRKAFNDGNLFS
jgi:hypothetical protein